MPGLITPELAKFLQREFLLDWNGIHGAGHWARVRWNGLHLAGATGANPRVVELFAFLHDARREHDGTDPEHGLRAAELAEELNGYMIHPSPEELRLLVTACRDHSDGQVRADITVQTCWDADRLDLGRVGKRPNPAYLCTEAAKLPKMIAIAYQRSIAGW